MASPAINPTPSPAGQPQGSGGAGAPSGSVAQDLSKLAMDSQKISAAAPETAPMMREVQNQIRMATMKVIQMRQQAQQATPQI